MATKAAAYGGMERRERLLAALTGARVDRVPVSAWGHFFTEEVDPDRFMAATMAFQRCYDCLLNLSPYLAWDLPVRKTGNWNRALHPV